MHEVFEQGGIEFLIRSGSVDKQNIDWILESSFLEVFENASIDSDSKVLDFGAHLGSFSILAAKKRECHVYAFEPDDQSFNLCKINVLLNKVDKNVSCYKLAVGGRTEQLNLYESVENWGHTILMHGGPYNILTGNKNQVQCLSLADALDFLKCDKCDFLKFNIEGAEFEMFEEASLDTLRKIKCMVGEIHFDLVKKSSDSLVLHLKNAGFSVQLDFFCKDRAILIAQHD